MIPRADSRPDVQGCRQAVLGFSDESAGAVTELLTAYRSRPWLLVSPGGNWGDRLIYAGAEALASRLGVEWTATDADGFAGMPFDSDRVVYLHGSGGFNPWGSGRALANFERALQQPSSVVIQGPQTCATDDVRFSHRLEQAFARRRCARVVLLARERTSFEFLEALRLPGVEAALDHDTALHLRAVDLLRLAELDAKPHPRYDLTVVREDDEAPRNSGPIMRRGVTLDPAYVAVSFRHWLRIHLYARSIATNRLHSAIAASIAGIPVTLSEGAYHKNRSVYEFSLAARGVQWSDGIPEAPAPSSGGWRLPIPAVLQNSWKVRQVRLFLQRVPLN